MAGEVRAVGVTAPALGALVGLDPVVFVHVTLELDFVSEASVADFALEDELVSVERHVVAEAVFALVDLGAAGVRAEVLLAQVDSPGVLVEATFLHVFLTAFVALKFRHDVLLFNMAAESGCSVVVAAAYGAHVPAGVSSPGASPASSPRPARPCPRGVPVSSPAGPALLLRGQLVDQPPQELTLCHHPL